MPKRSNADSPQPLHKDPPLQPDPPQANPRMDGKPSGEPLADEGSLEQILAGIDSGGHVEVV